MTEKNQPQESFMIRLSTFIVDKRNLVFLLIGIMLIFSAVSRNWVQVENDLTAYLPANSATRQGLDVMEEQFTTFGSADLMIANVDFEQAQRIADEIETTPGVQSVAFDETTDHYNHVSALYSITFDYPEDDERCLEAMNAVTTRYAAYDTYLKTSLGNQEAEIIQAEVNVIMVLVAIIVVAVLILTSQTYAEVPVLLLTFVTAMILNLGSNFLLGKISFVSNSVTSILQLALSLDYAVILCNRFKEEHKTLPLREAVIVALSKGIPEIGASSLTTIGGLVAMLFMQFKIGPDMGICLIKAILFALFAVFVLMPGLLMLFGPLMDKTAHRSFIPNIPFVGRFAYATRKVVPFLFAVLVVVAFNLSNRCPYVYGYDTIVTPKLNEQQIAEQMIRDNFTSSNLVALVVPTGDYESERAILTRLESMPQVDHTVGLSNTEALDGYKLTDRLTPRQFAELADLDYEAAQVVYAAYAAEHEDYGKIVGGIATYNVPLIDLFLFVVDQVDQGYVSLDTDVEERLQDAATQMRNGKLQLQGEDFSRMLVYLSLPVSGAETYEFTDAIKEIAQSYYPDGTVYVVGDSTNQYEFQKSFGRDNIVVSIMSILIVLVVLLFTFKSAGMPVLLILVIQGAIWLNFSVPVFTHVDLFFLGYLIVSSIQMGANIDYAIVIASRYMELKNEMQPRDAIIETMNFAFPTIVTSGSILAVSGILIGRMTSEGCIVGIGQSLGRGTIVSIILVMFVLPQILLLGGKIIEKTSFTVRSNLKHHTGRGRMVVDGMVRGEISGTVVGMVHATVDGDVNVVLLSGSVQGETPPLSEIPAQIPETLEKAPAETAEKQPIGSTEEAPKTAKEEEAHEEKH